MFDFHKDRNSYFQIQIDNTEEFVIPFIENYRPITAQMSVLEVGCGEGGVLKAFMKRGCMGVGVDLDQTRIDFANATMKTEVQTGQAIFICEDIYDLSFAKRFQSKFDIIILKDVIEHIDNKQKILDQLKTYLLPNGSIFFGFPPWRMPFGGHQQICNNKVLSRCPYLHLLPLPLYKKILTLAKESVQELLDVRRTRISIDSFVKLVKETGFLMTGKRLFLFNPIYKYKFKIKPREQFAIIRHIPYLRDFFTSCVYALITKKDL